jgi:hypothetical protein
MELTPNDINADASVLTYGFKATSRSIKPVHLGQVMFNHTLGYQHDPELLFEFLQKPGKVPSAELSETIKERFEFTHQRQAEDERLDRIRKTTRKTLANDNALYASQRGSAPTCTSDWFIIDPMTGVGAGRFLYQLIDRSGTAVADALTAQLSDHHDTLSVLFRPLVSDADREDATIKPWSEPDLGPAFADGHIATEFADGYATLGTHMKRDRGGELNYPRDLRRVVKFGAFAFYLYLANRYNEIRDPDEARETRVPIVLNYTGDRDNPVADASLHCADTVQVEVRATAREGAREVLDRRGAKSFSESEILEQIDSRELLDLNRNKESKIETDYEIFRDIYTGDTGDDGFEKLVNAMSDAINMSRYKTYTPLNTVETFGWRCGLLKPRGNRANERRYRPDPEMLEAILLTVVEPGESETLRVICDRLRRRYGLIVGGTDSDRAHLNEWGIEIGASVDEGAPLSNRNYDRFKQAVVDLGYAEEYADGVTIVSTTTNDR